MKQRLTQLVVALVLAVGLTAGVGYQPEPASAHGYLCFNWWLRTCHTHPSTGSARFGYQAPQCTTSGTYC